MSTNKYYLQERVAVSGEAAPRLSVAVRALVSVEVQHQVADLVPFSAHQLPREPTLQAKGKVEVNHRVLREQEVRGYVRSERFERQIGKMTMSTVLRFSHLQETLHVLQQVEAAVAAVVL